MLSSRIYAPLALGLAMLATPAAAITTITTSAYALYSDIRVVNTVGVTIAPQAATSGNASPGYNANNSVVSLDADIDLGVLSLVRTGLAVNTGLLTSNSTANGVNPGDTTAGSAQSQVNNLGVDLFTKVSVAPSITTLGIGADSISSLTNVTVLGSTAILTGQSVFENLNLTLLGLLNFDLGANAQVAANTSLINALGISILLNEQIVGGNGTTAQSLTTNAINIRLLNYSLGGKLLTGNLIIGHSYAEVNFDIPDPQPSVPEPAVWLQLIAGFGLTGIVVRRRRTLAAA